MIREEGEVGFHPTVGISIERNTTENVVARGAAETLIHRSGQITKSSNLKYFLFNPEQVGQKNERFRGSSLKKGDHPADGALERPDLLNTRMGSEERRPNRTAISENCLYRSKIEETQAISIRTESQT